MVSLQTSKYSSCMVCSAMVSLETGLNVPAPTWSVINDWAIFFSLSRVNIAGVKCSPAVGAATDPSVFAYAV